MLRMRCDPTLSAAWCSLSLARSVSGDDRGRQWSGLTDETVAKGIESVGAAIMRAGSNSFTPPARIRGVGRKGETAMELTPWVPLTRFDGPPEPIFRECRARIDRDALPEERESLLVVTHFMAGLRYNDRRLFEILGGRQVMIESQSPTDYTPDQSGPGTALIMTDDRRLAERRRKVTASRALRMSVANVVDSRPALCVVTGRADGVRVSQCAKTSAGRSASPSLAFHTAVRSGLPVFS